MKQTLLFIVIALVIIGGAYWFINQSSSHKNIIDINNQNNMQEQTHFQINDEIIGTGEGTVKAGDIVTVNYIGTLEDGTKFDSSYDHKTPFSFTVGAGQVIQGWEQGLIGMKVGGKRKLIIPYTMGYGEQGMGPIPPKATLIFEIELLKIQNANQ